MKTVVVAMSGGVDSSVSALLLKEQGYRVIGLFMRNWEEEDCPAAQDFLDVVAVCDKLDIPYYTVNFAKTYWDQVFSKFIDDLKLGFTPNPDVLCNSEIKFEALLEKALSLGDALATGHYCQIGENDELLRGNDPNKDQSYFLNAIPKGALKYVLFPIGHLPKHEVRAIAEKNDLITHNKRDSTGICFIGKRNFKEFISRYIDPKEGNLITPEGTIVGKHQGACYYTVGQRQGLGIGGPGEAWFVADKNIEKNTVTVVQGEDHPLLLNTSLIAVNPTWITEAPKFPLKCTAKIRYRQQDKLCTIHLENDQLHVEFDSPQRAITPGQSIVFYLEQVCLGGALIANAIRKPLVHS